MDQHAILSSLNDAQRQAVSAPEDSRLRVLAGAGSGKTRVLVHRVAWLIEVSGISPWSILAVTFTNRAANEMRARIEQILGYSTGGMWLGTFHGLAHRLLRRHWEQAGLNSNFQIIDAEDQLRLVRRVLRALELDESHWVPRQLQWYINSRKDEGLRPAHIEPDRDPVGRRLVEIYQAYEEARQRAGVVDFAELLLRAHELVRDDESLLAHYRERFRHLLVDEFQDTNAIQYAWLRLLAGDRGRLFAVGDDDQSIYGWRGARVENILGMERDFAGTLTIRMEQNYRSTTTILQAANALIGHNQGRLGKELWSAGHEGEPVEVYTAFNERDEARYVAERVQGWVEQGGSRSQIAVLYRSNAQSRLLEEALISLRIPYRVYGGLRFFERAEIKDALAYLRLLALREDDTAFERVVNTPARGIGMRTVDAVRAMAGERRVSLLAAARLLTAGTVLAARARNALSGFLDLVDQLVAGSRDRELAETVEHTIERSGLLDHHAKDRGGRGEDRVENLRELVNAARGFEPEAQPDAQPEELDPLSVFLAHAALEAGEGQAQAEGDCVQLMTMHSAKGLEFPMVMVVGMEEGLFPTSRAREDPVQVEEERRLCYVAVTRARERLVLCHAERRRLYGQDNYAEPSRFLAEIPAGLTRDVRPRAHLSRPVFSKPVEEATDPARAGLSPGTLVSHPKFGEGVVLRFEGSGTHSRVQVNFREHGTKVLVTSYAKLTPLVEQGVR
jgi:DNA helicase-2/ATP-dependent DNA helicase PcrA